MRWRDSVQRGPLLGAWARRSRSLALDSSYTFRPQLIQYSAGSFAVQKGPIPMTRLEWGILILAGLWALLTNITVRRHYKSSTTPQIPTNTFAMMQLLSVLTRFHQIGLSLSLMGQYDENRGKARESHNAGYPVRPVSRGPLVQCRLPTDALVARQSWTRKFRIVSGPPPVASSALTGDTFSDFGAVNP